MKSIKALDNAQPQLIGPQKTNGCCGGQMEFPA